MVIVDPTSSYLSFNPFSTSPLFYNREDAGEQLAIELEKYLSQEQARTGERIPNESLVVLAIPRGGVIIGDVIANRLHAHLDIIVSRKIGAPNNPELAVGAVMPDGSFFANERIIWSLGIEEDYIKQQIEIQRKEIGRRLIEYRGSTEYNYRLQDKIVILVDDGIATGATVLSAAKWLKQQQQCKKLITAVPIAPPPPSRSFPLHSSDSRNENNNDSVVDILERICDKVVILYFPQSFLSIGQFYAEFSQVTDEEVKAIMRKYGHQV
jgi:putative phosphoribosyl transferase